jgi:hypothetical protein
MKHSRPCPDKKLASTDDRCSSRCAVFIYVCMYVCMYHTYVCMYINVCMYIYIYICICIYVYIYIDVYTYMCVCVCVCIHPYIHKYIQINKYTTKYHNIFQSTRSEYSVKRDLIQCQKRPNTVSKETYHNIFQSTRSEYPRAGRAGRRRTSSWSDATPRPCLQRGARFVVDAAGSRPGPNTVS